jgi:hypothetical protein
VTSPDYPNVDELDGKVDLSSIIASIYAVGCFFGAIVAFSVGERLGRKSTPNWQKTLSHGAIYTPVKMLFAEQSLKARIFKIPFYTSEISHSTRAVAAHHKCRYVYSLSKPRYHHAR